MTIEQMRDSLLRHMGVPCSEPEPCHACAARREELAAFEAAIRKDGYDEGYDDGYGAGYSDGEDDS